MQFDGDNMRKRQHLSPESFPPTQQGFRVVAGHGDLAGNQQQSINDNGSNINYQYINNNNNSNNNMSPSMMHHQQGSLLSPPQQQQQQQQQAISSTRLTPSSPPSSSGPVFRGTSSIGGGGAGGPYHPAGATGTVGSSAGIRSFVSSLGPTMRPMTRHDAEKLKRGGIVAKVAHVFKSLFCCGGNPATAIMVYSALVCLVFIVLFVYAYQNYAEHGKVLLDHGFKKYSDAFASRHKGAMPPPPDSELYNRGHIDRDESVSKNGGGSTTEEQLQNSFDATKKNYQREYRQQRGDHELHENDNSGNKGPFNPTEGSGTLDDVEDFEANVAPASQHGEIPISPEDRKKRLSAEEVELLQNLEKLQQQRLKEAREGALPQDLVNEYAGAAQEQSGEEGQSVVQRLKQRDQTQKRLLTKQTKAKLKEFVHALTAVGHVNVAVTENRNKAFLYWLQAIEKGYIRHPISNTLIHISSLHCLEVPQSLTTDHTGKDHDWLAQTYRGITPNNYIMPLAYYGVVSKIVWVKPKWVKIGTSEDIPAGSYTFKIGNIGSSTSVGIDSGSSGNAATATFPMFRNIQVPAERMTNVKLVELQVITLEDWLAQGEDLGKRSQMKRYELLAGVPEPNTNHQPPLLSIDLTSLASSQHETDTFRHSEKSIASMARDIEEFLRYIYHLPALVKKSKTKVSRPGLVVVSRSVKYEQVPEDLWPTAEENVYTVLANTFRDGPSRGAKRISSGGELIAEMTIAKIRAKEAALEPEEEEEEPEVDVPVTQRRGKRTTRGSSNKRASRNNKRRRVEEEEEEVPTSRKRAGRTIVARNRNRRAPARDVEEETDPLQRYRDHAFFKKRQARKRNDTENQKRGKRPAKVDDIEIEVESEDADEDETDTRQRYRKRAPTRRRR